MPTTTNYSITLPTVGGNKNTWGSVLNDAFTVLEQKTYDVDQCWVLPMTVPLLPCVHLAQHHDAARLECQYNP